MKIDADYFSKKYLLVTYNEEEFLTLLNFPALNASGINSKGHTGEAVVLSSGPGLGIGFLWAVC